MWCPSCRAEVAAELSIDNRRMLCARCQTELGITSAAASQIANQPRTTEAERDARELLARWSAQNLLDVPAPGVGAGPFAKPNGSVDLPLTRPELRFDAPRSAVPVPSSAFMTASTAKQGSSVISFNESTSGPSHQNEPRESKAAPIDRMPTGPIHESSTTSARLSDPPQNATQLDSEHGDVHNEYRHVAHDAAHTPVHPASQSTWSMLAGQICAYAGVGLLTCGSVLVMWSYFGGPPKYLPMGWLTAAVGQMLLFLGITTLISSGMKQTTSEVAWRIDFLADEVHHMEIALGQLESEQQKARRQRTRSHPRRADEGPSKDAA